MYLSAFALLTFCSFALSQDSQIKIDISPSQKTKSGLKVEITCTPSSNFLIIEHSLNIYKISLDDANRKKRISSHNVVDSGDYRVELKSVEGGRYSYTLIIDAVKDADDGYYRCQVEKSGQVLVIADTDIIVIKPVTDVIMQIGKWTFVDDDSGNIKQVKEYSSMPFNCLAKGSNPRPEMMVSIDGDDVTADILKAYDPITTERYKGSEYNGIRTHTYQLKSSRLLKKEHLGKKIICMALTEGADQVPEVASAIIQLNEMPQIMCKDERVPLGQAAIMTCKISHSLAPVKNVKWIEQKTQKVITPQGKVPGYLASIKEIGNNTIETTLKIDKLPRINNIYQIEIDHAGWRRDHLVRATLIRSETKDPGGCSNIAVMPFLVAVATIFARVLQ